MKPPAPEISGTLLPGGRNFYYQDGPDVTGGQAPLSFAVTNGVLPPGLTINAGTGLISGTPTAVGVYTFDITVADSWVPPQTGTGTFAINVKEVPLEIITLSIHNGIPNVPYQSTTFKAIASNPALQRHGRSLQALCLRD